MLSGTYFDGKSSKAHRVQVRIEPIDQEARLRVYKPDGQLWFEHKISDLEVSDPFRGAATRFDAKDGAVVEIPDSRACWAMLEQAGYRKTFVQARQSMWRWAVGCAVGVMAAGFLLFRYAIPAMAGPITAVIPDSVDQKILEAALPEIEAQLFPPSKLTAERQKQLSEEFARRVAMIPDAPKYELRFRSSKMGPNAVAMPGGLMIMTDELVALAKSDDAIYGVLFHELGHIKYRHSMQTLVQQSAVAALVTIFLGDASGLIVVIPSTLANSSYSRDLEREADLYALQAMIATNTPTKPLIDLFVRLDGTRKASIAEKLLSTHPVTEERIELWRTGKVTAK